MSLDGDDTTSVQLAINLSRSTFSQILELNCIKTDDPQDQINPLFNQVKTFRHFNNSIGNRVERTQIYLRPSLGLLGRSLGT